VPSVLYLYICIVLDPGSAGTKRISSGEVDPTMKSVAKVATRHHSIEIQVPTEEGIAHE
jgi:hypothetical protein